MRRLLLTCAALAVAVGTAPPVQADPTTPAQPAHPQVSVTPATLAPSGPTTLTITGTGFTSLPHGFGGAYVLFGHVEGTWQPSRGGVTGRGYRYQVDSETKPNHGYQVFVSYPHGATLSAAQAVMSASGSWHTTLTVPGPTLHVAGADGTTSALDCRTLGCGVITIGAHGVVDAGEETYTAVPVRGTTAARTTTRATSYDRPATGHRAHGSTEPVVLSGVGAVAVLGLLALATGSVRRRRHTTT